MVIVAMAVMMVMMMIMMMMMMMMMMIMFRSSPQLLMWFVLLTAYATGAAVSAGTV
jgi:hypothetical protein